MPLPLTVFCFSKIQIGFTFLVPAHPGSPGKRAVKRMCMCVCTLSLTNRLRTGQGPCRTNLHKRRLAQSPSCDCGRRQTMNHIVNTCPSTKFEGGLNLLHEADGKVWMCDAGNTPAERHTQTDRHAHHNTLLPRGGEIIVCGDVMFRLTCARSVKLAPLRSDLVS